MWKGGPLQCGFRQFGAQLLKTAVKPHTPLGSLDLLPQLQAPPPSNVFKFLRNWSSLVRLQTALLSHPGVHSIADNY